MTTAADRALLERLVAGPVSGDVLAREADETSGALITAEFAAEQGREVFAVPGSILAPQSKGTNKLIQQGAFVRSVADQHDDRRIDRVAVDRDELAFRIRVERSCARVERLARGANHLEPAAAVDREVEAPHARAGREDAVLDLCLLPLLIVDAPCPQPVRRMIVGGEAFREVKITDFGLAKCFRENANAQTQSGAILGTPCYMSPEQAEETRGVAGRADMYSLGCGGEDALFRAAEEVAR